MTPKAMIILWKWEELKNSNPRYDKIPVRKAPEKFLIRVSDEEKGSPEELVQQVNAAIKKYAPKGELLILLHKSALGPSFQDDIASGRSHRSLSTFGGGDNFIYYNKNRDTGLINQTGKLAEDEFYTEEMTNKEGETEWLRRHAPGVVDKEGKNKWLKEPYFDKAWDYYTHECKKLIYEFMEQLYHDMAGAVHTSPPSDKLAVILGNKVPLKQKLERLLSEELSEKIQKLYDENSGVDTHFRKLQTFLREEKWSSRYLNHAREHFQSVLNAMPESIY